MDAVDDIFSTPNLSLWESPHVASVFPLASSPHNPQNFLRHSDNSAFPSTDNSFQHPLTDPQDLPPDLSPSLASSFALPNSLPFSIPPNISQLQNLAPVFSQSLAADNSLQHPQFNHSSLPFDFNSLPNTAESQHPSLDPNPQFPPSLSHQSFRHHHQPHPVQPKSSPNPPTAKSHSALHHTTRRNQPPTPNRSLQKTRHTRQPKRNPPSRNSLQHQQPPQQPPTLADNPQFLSNTSTATTRSRQTQSAPQRPVTSIPPQHHIPTSQSNSNLLSDQNSSAPISRLSSISIPTPTIATATTTAASPSTTNATHRSPPHTPPSAKRPKSTATSNPKRSQVEPRSGRPKGDIDKKPKQPQPTPSNHHRTTQTTAKQNPTLPTPTSPSASTHHNTLQHSTTHRVSKPRDKHARLRKRLKCCSQDQLVDHIIQLVRSSTLPEKNVTDNLPKVDIHRYVLKCRELRDSILCQLPPQPTNPSAPFDATAFRKCKKSLAVFRTSVVNMAKTLVEASLWTDVIEFCIAADGVNAETPVWSEASHNRTKRSVRTKLEQFALKAATALSKPKEAAAFNHDDHARAMQGCQGVFPDVVAKLKRQTPSLPTESLTRSQDFDDPMISTTQLDIDL